MRVIRAVATLNSGSRAAVAAASKTGQGVRYFTLGSRVVGNNNGEVSGQPRWTGNCRSEFLVEGRRQFSGSSVSRAAALSAAELAYVIPPPFSSFLETL